VDRVNISTAAPLIKADLGLTNTQLGRNLFDRDARHVGVDARASLGLCTGQNRGQGENTMKVRSAAEFMRQIGKTTALAAMILATGIAALVTETTWRQARAQQIAGLNARLVATNIPGTSAIAQIGNFIDGGRMLQPGACANPSPIPTKFPGFTESGKVLDPNRLLVGSTSNFGAPLPASGGRQGSLLSIDPSGPNTLVVPVNFDSKGDQEATSGGAVQMFSANSPHWLNGVNNPNAFTAGYTGVGNPLGLSNNNGFGRIWPANAPFGLNQVGSSSILDPTGLPLKGAPNALIVGVYVGDLTNRNSVTPPPPQVGPPQPQVIPGALHTAAVGTALLGPSPDGTCKAVFVVVTADGAIVQEHTLYGLDGLAPLGTVRPVLGGNGNAQQEGIEPRFGVLMNPYNLPQGVIRQLFVSEPFYDTIAVVNLTVVGTAPYQVFGLGSVSRIHSTALNIPVDLTPVVRNTDDSNWASNTTLDEATGSVDETPGSGSDFYVANQGDNTIVRMKQDGTVVAIRQVTTNGQPLDNVSLNGIAASTDATDTTPPSTIFATFVDPNSGQGGVLAMPGF